LIRPDLIENAEKKKMMKKISLMYIKENLKSEIVYNHHTKKKKNHIDVFCKVKVRRLYKKWYTKHTRKKWSLV